MKGQTDAANALARFLRTMTDSLTVRELAERYGGGKTLWGEYRSGARIIPLGRLNTVVRDRVRDVRGREAMLEQARRLHDGALTAEVARTPAPALDEALHRAERDLAESGLLVNRLLAIITMLLKMPAPVGPPAPEPPGQRVREHLDEAFGQLDTAWSVQTAARRAYAGARAESAAGAGPEATAGPELSLALALVGSALEHRRAEALRLWEGIREDGYDRAAPGLDDVAEVEVEVEVEGIVLERTDTATTAAVTVTAPAPEPDPGDAAAPVGAAGAVGAVGQVGEVDRPGPALPVPMPAPTRPRRFPLAAVAAAALVGITTIAAAATVVLVTRHAAPAPAGNAAPRWELSPVPLPFSVPTPTPSPTPTTSPAPTTASPTAPPPAGPSTPAAPPPAPPSQSPSPSPADGGRSPAPTPSDPAPGSPKDPPAPPKGPFRLTNTGSGMCLAPDGGSTMPSEGLVQTECAENSAQFWTLTAEASGPEGTVYAVRNRHSGLCLSVDAARTTDGVPVTQYLCGDEDGLFADQFWTFRYHASSQAWQLVNRKSGKCASVRPGEGQTEPVLQNGCVTAPSMLWRA
ncbi:RICIN domain-containing protein [Streptomyces sp. NPDC059989]|uniref:RICIN domain-containing protein n=1 Tax=Streptomyces sp. NPDC059989 TaxID=3347026 RepID=UPI00367768FC